MPRLGEMAIADMSCAKRYAGSVRVGVLFLSYAGAVFVGVLFDVDNGLRLVGSPLSPWSALSVVLFVRGPLCPWSVVRRPLLGPATVNA